ncbi:hypothetical protein O3M35_012132 [Rhynocoris fuscipes]|uniref:Gustatory receptor n=1 Tax=Rhynocoris fuscipes TaxID=488301 RepID=A0AAW1CYN2_9HEMI
MMRRDRIIAPKYSNKIIVRSLNINHIENAMDSINFLPKLFGLYPFYKIDSKHYFSLMHFLIALPMHLLYWFLNIIVIINADNSWTPFDYLQISLRMYAVTITVHYTLIWMIFNVKLFNDIVDNLKIVENSLKRLGLVFQHKVNYAFTIESTVMVSMTIPLAILMSDRSWYAIIRIIINFGIIYSMCIQAKQISDIIFVITELFSMLSLNTKNIQHFNDSNKTIDIFLYCHDLLKSVCASLNNLYSPFLMLCLTTCFARITLAIFTILDFKSVLDVVYLSAVALLYSLPAYRVATVCSRCINKANEFDDILFSLVHNNNTVHLARNIKVHLHIANRRKLTFTAFGLFQVNVGVLGKMIATAVTYLVIMLQLKAQFNLDQAVTND